MISAENDSSAGLREAQCMGKRMSDVQEQKAEESGMEKEVSRTTMHALAYNS